MDVKTADKSKTENEIKQQLRVERKRLQQAQKAAKQENKQKNTEEHRQSREKPSEKSNTGENSNINLPKKDECAVEENKSEPKVLSPSDDNVQTRKAELRAERRQKQEMQRAAKMANKTESEASKSACSAPKKVADSSIKPGDDNVRKKIAKKPTNKKLPASEPADKIVKLFSHLVQHENASIMKSTKSSNLHPAILHLGQQYAQGIIVGSNARCVALLLALKQVVNDYVTPPHKELCRDLEAKIKPYTSFLNKCRPLAVSMENAIKHIQFQIGNIPSNTPDSEAKRDLKKAIEKYEYVNIVLARQVITGTATKKIVDGDVILTYACSSLIKAVLLEAKRLQIKFSVVVVDGRPKMEGKELVRFLVRNKIRCTYVTINAVSCIMKEVTKVMLGAHALQANGYVMSRIGCSQIALVAKAYNVPVLVCCGTYKFCEQVQVDSFVYNELGDPNELACPPNVQILNNWKDIRSLSLLNLVYDVTPPHLVTAVITEKGMLPCTSVPAVLRVLQDEIQN